MIAFKNLYKADHITSNFLKAVSHKFYLVHSWIPWPISLNTIEPIWQFQDTQWLWPCLGHVWASLTIVIWNGSVYSFPFFEVIFMQKHNDPSIISSGDSTDHRILLFNWMWILGYNLNISFSWAWRGVLEIGIL